MIMVYELEIFQNIRSLLKDKVQVKHGFLKTGQILKLRKQVNM